MTQRDRLIVDGYNAIHAWPSLKSVLERHGLEAARRGLIRALAGYAAARDAEVTVVFDSHDRQRVNNEAVHVEDGVRVLFGNSLASADNVIERLVSDAARAQQIDHMVVATSDRLQAGMVRAMGVGTMSSPLLLAEVVRAADESGDHARRLTDRAGFARSIEHQLSDDVRARLERIRRGEE